MAFSDQFVKPNSLNLSFLAQPGNDDLSFERLNIIACCDSKYGIAREGKIPWSFKEDMELFKEITKDSVIIMGRKTWDSLPKKPLPNRHNIVISSKNMVINDNISLAQSPEMALKMAKSFGKMIFIIGGEQIYKYFIENFTINSVMLTIIDHDYNCDQYFPINLLTDKEERNTSTSITSIDRINNIERKLVLVLIQ